MVCIALVRLRPDQADADLVKKSEDWWNNGGRPAGLKTLAGYGCLGTGPNVYVFETDSHDDLRKQVHFWSEFDFEIFPAVELLEEWRQQGMNVQ